MKNFIKLDDLSILSVPYMYIDHSDYLADALFNQNQIHMRFKEESLIKILPTASFSAE